MLRPYLRASYAIGYAEYGSVVSEDAKAECAFLLEVTPQFGDEIVEAARHLAKFRGLKDSVVIRRNALSTKFNDRLRPLLADLSRKTAHAVVRAVRPTEDDQSDILKALKAGLSPEEWQQLLQDAWQEANAEGNVDAQAFLAMATNMPNVSFDQAFPQAVDALRDLDFSDKFQWIEKMLNGTAYFVGNDLAKAIENGASYDELLQIASEGIAGGEGAELMLDTMISTGVSQGTLDLYDSEGVQSADIITSAIDDECSDAADDNPWPLDEARGMLPFHENCRCSWAPTIE